MKRYRFKTEAECDGELPNGWISDMRYLYGKELLQADALEMEKELESGGEGSIYVSGDYKDPCGQKYTWGVHTDCVVEIKEDPKPVDVWDIDFIIADIQENGAVYGTYDGGGPYLFKGSPAKLWSYSYDSPQLLYSIGVRGELELDIAKGKLHKMHGTNEKEMVEKLKSKKRIYNKENT